ncbi:L-histidine N(alpha)-methyltransferase [Streptomyces sp. RLB3-6]|uniref:L-histidine N(alpha)-methyltransferase n=1 Tax=Streptomyces sp. RLB3-6 TaxID=2594457 RepID=UPI0011634195|nr:L-histidine N(alpha)-methyltransferase [Streptomyces sp. RLB3-6]QDN84404.1 L-histidine N(alpha)-methyltransferase [Streptomyces sp. RLB3-6]
MTLTITRTLPHDATAAALRDDVRCGLTRTVKSLPPKWFYDAHGSALFERITTDVAAYYPTRAERDLLAARAGDIAAATRARTLIELGSGAASEKTRLLLGALTDLHTYVPVDVSESALREAGEALTAERPGLDVHGLIADFTQHLALPAAPGPRLVALLGSTIGNLLPAERTAFFTSMRALLEPGDALLLGVDLVKDPSVLVAAYDDRETGITSAFNKNVLTVINRELGADFEPDAFEHVALWDAEREWIEMRLRSRTAQTVKIPALDLLVDFAAGEDLRTEISAKFRRPGLAVELARAGLDMAAWFTSPAQQVAMALGVPALSAPQGAYAPGTTACIR